MAHLPILQQVRKIVVVNVARVNPDFFFM